MKFARLLYLTLCASLFYPPLSSAEQATISVAQLNQSLTNTFPFSREYQGVSATFSAPAIVLKHLDNEIEIKVSIEVTYQEQRLLAKGLIKGKASLQPVTNTLRFEQPWLDEFFVQSDNMDDSQPALKIVKQTIGKTLPPMVLLDFEQVDVYLLNNQPSGFSLSPRGLIIEY